MTVVGLIPAAGHGTRLGALPFSKELYPVGFVPGESGVGASPKAVAHYLLESMSVAGVPTAYVVIRRGKWDIPHYFGNGNLFGIRLAYLTLEASPGVPFTLDQAYPFVKGATVAFGFPDILFSPKDSFMKLLAKQSETKSDIVLGLWPAKLRSQYDSVVCDRDGVVTDLIVKPSPDQIHHSWAIAVWGPRYTEFLHEYTQENWAAAGDGPELSAGHAIKASIASGLRVQAAILGDEPYLDIGTPEDLARAVQRGAKNFEVWSETERQVKYGKASQVRLRRSKEDVI